MVTLKERSKTDKTQAENLTFAALAKKKKKLIVLTKTIKIAVAFRHVSYTSYPMHTERKKEINRAYAYL